MSMVKVVDNKCLMPVLENEQLSAWWPLMPLVVALLMKLSWSKMFLWLYEFNIMATYQWLQKGVQKSNTPFSVRYSDSLTGFQLFQAAFWMHYWWNYHACYWSLVPSVKHLCLLWTCGSEWAFGLVGCWVIELIYTYYSVLDQMHWAYVLVNLCELVRLSIDVSSWANMFFSLVSLWACAS